MAELRDKPFRAAGLGTGPLMTLAGLSREREYTPVSDTVKAAANPSPREVVGRLHEQMAASSPRLAALVAVYDDVKAGRRGPLTAAEARRELGRAPRRWWT